MAKKLGDFYDKLTTSNGSNNMLGLYATLRIMAKTASGTPVNASKCFPIFTKENRKDIVFEGEFQPTLRNNHFSKL